MSPCPNRQPNSDAIRPRRRTCQRISQRVRRHVQVRCVVCDAENRLLIHDDVRERVRPERRRVGIQHGHAEGIRRAQVLVEQRIDVEVRDNGGE